MSNRAKFTTLALALTICVSAPFVSPAPVSANGGFKGLFTGIFKSLKDVPLTVFDTAWRNPVLTAKILNQRVFKIKGSDKFLADAQKYYDKYYGRQILGVLRGRNPSPNVLIDIAAKESGLLPNGIPRDLNSILDTILGPDKTTVATANCNASGPGSCKYTKILQDLQTPVDKVKIAAIEASTGPIGIPNPYLVRKALLRAGKQGVSNDRLLQNPITAAVAEANETDRQIVRAFSETQLGEQGQENLKNEIEAIEVGLEGVNETARTGLEATTTQDVAKAILASNAQMAGFFGIIAADTKQQKIADALKLNQLANISQANDAQRRSRDAEVIAEARQALYNMRVRPIR